MRRSARRRSTTRRPQLITLKQWDRAIGVLEGFRRDYPKSELQPDVGRKLAVAYTEGNRPVGPGGGGVRADRARIRRNEAGSARGAADSRLISTPRRTTTPKAVIDAGEVRRDQSDADRRCDGSAPAAGGHRGQGRRCREARSAGIARSSKRIRPRAALAPIARSISPRKRSFHWLSRCVMRSAGCA